MPTAWAPCPANNNAVLLIKRRELNTKCRRRKVLIRSSALLSQVGFPGLEAILPGSLREPARPRAGHDLNRGLCASAVVCGTPAQGTGPGRSRKPPAQGWRQWKKGPLPEFDAGNERIGQTAGSRCRGRPRHHGRPLHKPRNTSAGDDGQRPFQQRAHAGDHGGAHYRAGHNGRGCGDRIQGMVYPRNVIPGDLHGGGDRKTRSASGKWQSTGTPG